MQMPLLFPLLFVPIINFYRIIIAIDGLTNTDNSPFAQQNFLNAIRADPKTTVCTNGGRFLRSFCLADYNCDQGRQASKQVCIRGRCCTKTNVRKNSANRRTNEDRRHCPSSGTFSVGLTCRQNRDCIRKAGLPASGTFPSSFSFPLLECSRNGRCCTTSRYRKPLKKGEWCLNGGRALGAVRRRRRGQGAIGQRMNNGDDAAGMMDDGIDQCAVHRDCQGASRPLAMCVDGQCCTRARMGSANNRRDQQRQNDWEESEEGDKYWDGEEDDGIGGEGGEDGGSIAGGSDDDGSDRFGRGRGQQLGRELLREGKRICRSNGGMRYKRVMLCSRSSACPSRQNYLCTRGHCCLRERAAQNVQNDLRGHCSSSARFRRFMGAFCQRSRDCFSLVDVNNGRAQTTDIRCVRGACCATATTTRTRPRRQRDDEADVSLPLRRSGSSAFCFDGTLSNRQCWSEADCAMSSGQSCVNGLCCAIKLDQQQYACGGLASAGHCTPSLARSSSAGCHDRLYCNSPGACCECRYGQPQQGVTNCRNGQQQCISGYSCDSNSGFCCPRCPNGRTPFGSCYRGKCARGYKCHPGNICCRNGGNEIEEEEEEYPDSYEDEEDYSDWDEDDWQKYEEEMGRGGREERGMERNSREIKKTKRD